MPSAHRFSMLMPLWLPVVTLLAVRASGRLIGLSPLATDALTAFAVLHATYVGLVLCIYAAGNKQTAATVAADVFRPSAPIVLVSTGLWLLAGRYLPFIRSGKDMSWPAWVALMVGVIALFAFSDRLGDLSRFLPSRRQEPEERVDQSEPPERET